MVKFLTQPFRWYGSKAKMRSRILDVLATIPRKLYVEPFGGSGSIFFGKSPEKSIYNDTNGLLVNFFRKLRSKSDRDEIKEITSFVPESRTYWYEMKEVCKAYQTGDKDRLDEAIRAANLKDYDETIAVAVAFFYCQNFAFSGTVLNSYGEKLNDATSSPGYESRIANLDEYAQRLALCNITDRDFRDCIAKHDGTETLFYLDPPYEVKSNREYRSGWTSADTSDLVAILCDLKGSAVLSCYDGELYRPLLDAGYEKRDFTTQTTIRRSYDDGSIFDRVETLYWRRSEAAERQTLLF